MSGAYFTFEQLCGNNGSRQSMAVAGALSANDYLALVQSCRHLFVEGLPQLQPNQRDEVGGWLAVYVHKRVLGWDVSQGTIVKKHAQFAWPHLGSTVHCPAVVLLRPLTLTVL
jgi:hypothetical protein